MGNREGYVSQRVLKALSKPVPSAFQLDYFLKELTVEHGVTWDPDPPPREFMWVAPLLSIHASINKV